MFRKKENLSNCHNMSFSSAFRVTISSLPGSYLHYSLFMSK